jgi:hypothetical protein
MSRVLASNDRSGSESGLLPQDDAELTSRGNCWFYLPPALAAPFPCRDRPLGAGAFLVLVGRHATRVQGAAEPGSILITATVDRVAALAMTGRPNLP